MDKQRLFKAVKESATIWIVGILAIGGYALMLYLSHKWFGDWGFVIFCGGSFLLGSFSYTIWTNYESYLEARKDE